MTDVESISKPIQGAAFAKLPALADRLGVSPLPEEHPTTTLFVTPSGDYDLFDMVNALLDKLGVPQ